MWDLIMRLIQTESLDDLIEKQNEIEIICEILYKVCLNDSECQSIIGFDELYKHLEKIKDYKNQQEQMMNENE